MHLGSMRLNWRTIYVGLLALQIILAAYFLFTYLGGRSHIRIEKAPSAKSHPAADSNEVGRVGPVGVGTVEKARFVNFNEDKQVSREFGFERLLHKAGDQWQIAKPFLNIYQPDFECQITAQTGVIIADELGEIADIKEATLRDDVVVHITPKQITDFGQVDIYLDDIVFISNRSLFLTAGPVKILAKDMQLLGRGLELVYNYNDDRLELFRIVDLESLCLNRIAGGWAWLYDESTDGPATFEQNQLAGSQADASAQRYRAVLTANVMVRSAGHLLLADDKLTIQNVIRRKNAVDQTLQAPPHEPEIRQAGGEKDYLDVIVTCHRGLVVFPMDMSSPQAGLLTTGLTQPTAAESSHTQMTGCSDVNSLVARNIEFDASTRRGQAFGPLTLTCHTKDYAGEGNDITVTVRAQERLTFAPDSRRMVFEGDCISTFLRTDAAKPRRYTVAAPKITAVLAAKSQSTEPPYLQHIAAEGGVTAVVNDLKAGRDVAQFAAPRIDYFAEGGNIIATGPSELIIFGESTDMQVDESKMEPVRITAKEAVRFDPASNIMFFEGGCFCETTVGHPSQPRKYTLSAQSIVVELLGEQGKPSALQIAGLKRILARQDAVLTAISIADQSKVAEFTASQIEYNSANDNVSAPGPSRLLLFTENLGQLDTQTDAPVTITAQDSALFSLASNQAIFRGRCMCTMIRMDDGIARKYKLAAPEVTVDVASAGGGVFGSSGINYLTAGDDAMVVVTPINSVTELARFTAARIRYAAANESITADGPCDFTFYANDFLPTPTLGSAVPVQIYADHGAKFLPAQNQLTFEGNCICTMVRSGLDSQSKYTLAAPKITLNLSQREQQNLAASALGIDRFTADGGVVQISNVKTVSDRLAAFSKIKCTQFVYDTGDKLFTAVGPGVITVDNSNIDEPPEHTNSFGITGRCYAFLRDFETLRFDLRTNRIIARNDEGKILADYFPIINGQRQQQIKASAGLIEVQLGQTDNSRDEISAFRAAQGVTYEDPNNQFMAGEMSYDARTSLLKARGSDFHRCYLNGAIVDNIVYDLNRRAVLNIDVTDAGRAQIAK